MSNGWLSLSRRSFLLSTDGLSIAKLRLSSVMWCSPKPRPRSACSGKAASWCAGPLASEFRCSIWLPVLFFYDHLIIFHSMAGPRQEDGWIACTVLPQLISMPPSPSPSDFSARAHARYSEHLNPASWLLFSIFISSKLVAAKPSGRLFWYACSNLTCIFTSLNIKFSYLSTTIYEKEKFQWYISNFLKLSRISWCCRTCEFCKVKSFAHMWSM